MKDGQGNRNKRFLWRCHGCKRQFSVRIGSIFEDSRIPLRIWCHAFWRACSSKKGVSALQISRETGISYKSALFLMHRIRFAMGEDWSTPPKLSGTVEADETFIGGKPRYRNQRDAGTGKRITGRGSRKTPVMALVERGGNVRLRKLERITAKQLQGAIREMAEPEAVVMTDDERSYVRLRHPFWFRGEHHTVNHRRREYARGDAHINTAESVFSLIKRGLVGTFHSVSKKHLPLYLNEFEFRWNTRNLDDGKRTLKTIRSSDGKRLSYGCHIERHA